MELVIPEKLKEQSINLFPFQEEIIRDMLSSPSPHIYNACDMGLGKTAQSIVYANTMGHNRLLIVCPALLRLNWQREIETWFHKDTDILTILSSKDVTEDCRELPVVIVSYDLLATNKKVFQFISDMEFDIGIFDEFHYCKNMEAKRTAALLWLWDNKLPEVMCLSGTPMTNSAADLFPALSRIIPDLDHMGSDSKRLCGDFDEFVNHFTYVHKHPTYGTTYRDARNIDTLKKILDKGQFFFRKTKEAVLEDLPDKIYDRIDIDLEVATDMSDEAIETYINNFEKDGKIVVDKALGTLRRELGEAKVSSKDTTDYIKSFLDAGKPVVIFAYHKNVIAELKVLYKKYNPVVLDGSTSATNKQKAVDDFQNGKTDVFIGQVQAAGVGITLTRSSDCFFIEYDWLPSVNEQAIDRLHRIGQKDTVTAHYIVSRNAFDIALIKAMIRKQKIINRVI